MYLTDLQAGSAPRYDLVRYALYIAFFPQVLAGPLVRWSEIMHQFDERPYRAPGRGRALRPRPDAARASGLAKKVFLGDPLAGLRQSGLPGRGGRARPSSMVEAWQATLGFTFQIYFDFSGYTDMALGLALLFGIVLPQNFDVPYRADLAAGLLAALAHDAVAVPARLPLHRRWAATGSGLAVQVGALFATMTLGGLWHGAGLHLRRLGRGARLRRSARACSGAGPGCRCRALLGWVADLRVRGAHLGAVPGRAASRRPRGSTRACSASRRSGAGVQVAHHRPGRGGRPHRPDGLGASCTGCRRARWIAVVVRASCS